MVKILPESGGTVVLIRNIAIATPFYSVFTILYLFENMFLHIPNDRPSRPSEQLRPQQYLDHLSTLMRMERKSQLLHPSTEMQIQQALNHRSQRTKIPPNTKKSRL